MTIFCKRVSLIMLIFPCAGIGAAKVEKIDHFPFPTVTTGATTIGFVR